jgi:hypothetical protein
MMNHGLHRQEEPSFDEHSFVWGSTAIYNPLYLIPFSLEIYHLFLEILRTFNGIFLRLRRSEYSFSVGGTFLS